MLLVLDIRNPDRNLRDMTSQIVVKVGLVVDFEHDVAQAMLNGSRGIAGRQWAQSDTIAQEKLLVERGKLLELQSESRVALVDELLQSLDGLRTRGSDELFSLRLCCLNLGLVVRVCDLQFTEKIFLVLRSTLHALETNSSGSFGIAGTGTVVVLCQTIVLGLCLFHGGLGIGSTLLSIQAFVLPVFPALFHVERELIQIFVHLVQSQGELHAVVGDSIVEAHSLIQTGDIGALSRLLGMDVVGRLLDQATQSFGMVFFYCSTLFQKIGKVLGLVFSLAPTAEVTR